MDNTKAPWEVIGEQFVRHYYEVFELNREQVVAFYASDALFTFENHMAQGQQAIKEILTEKLRFQAIRHAVTKVDCQPTAESGVIMLVTGQLKTDEDPPHGYSQVFYLKNVNGQYCITHDIFRLLLHNN